MTRRRALRARRWAPLLRALAVEHGITLRIEGGVYTIGSGDDCTVHLDPRRAWDGLRARAARTVAADHRRTVVGLLRRLSDRRLPVAVTLLEWLAVQS